MIIVIIVIILGFALWSRFISTSGLIIKEYTVENDRIPNEFDGAKIIHFSDLHYASTILENELIEIVEKINEYKPDIVIFTGDLFDKNYKVTTEDIEIVTKNLSKIKASLGKYAVTGNHDYEYDGYKTIIKDSNFKLLNNSYELIFNKGNTPILISGVPSSIKEKNELEFLSINDELTYYNIFLAHEPDTLSKVRQYNIDLMLSGHSHGGQVRLPFIGALFTPIGSKMYYDEYYKVDETDLYISSGIGTSALKIRFLNKPSINLYRLSK